MNQAIVALASGLALGGTLALIGIGFALAFRATQTLNFAQGSMMLLGAVVVARMQVAGLPLWLALIASMALCCVMATIFYFMVLQRTTGLPHFMAFVATLGLALMIEGGVAMWIGSNQYSIDVPLAPTGVTSVFGARVNTASIVFAGVSFALAAAIALALRRTAIGNRLRAAGQNPVLASQGGIHVRRYYAVAWGMVGFLGFVAGVSYGATNIVDITLPELALAAFPAIFLGGLDSIAGAILGGSVIGLLQGFTATYLGGEYIDVVCYSVLLLVLLIRPRGFLGTEQVTRL